MANSRLLSSSKIASDHQERLSITFEYFIERFVELFFQKLRAYEHEVLQSRAMPYSEKMTIATSVAMTHSMALNPVFSVAPISSQYISGKTINFVQGKWRRIKAKRIYNFFFHIDRKELKTILVEVGSHLFQSFENVFTRVTVKDGTAPLAMHKLALTAVKSCMQYIELSSHHKLLPRVPTNADYYELITKSVVCYLKQNSLIAQFFDEKSLEATVFLEQSDGKSKKINTADILHKTPIVSIEKTGNEKKITIYLDTVSEKTKKAINDIRPNDLTLFGLKFVKNNFFRLMTPYDQKNIERSKNTLSFDLSSHENLPYNTISDVSRKAMVVTVLEKFVPSIQRELEGSINANLEYQKEFFESRNKKKQDAFEEQLKALTLKYDQTTIKKKLDISYEDFFFKKDVLNLKDFLNSKALLLHISFSNAFLFPKIALSESFYDLQEQKIKDIDFIYHTLDKFFIKKEGSSGENEIQQFQNAKERILIIACSDYFNYSQLEVDQFFKVLKNVLQENNKKVIILSIDSNQKINNALLSFSAEEQRRVIGDAFTWHDLSTDMQTRVLNHEVIFQGFSTSFQALFSEDDLSSILKNQGLLDVFEAIYVNKPLIIGEALEFPHNEIHIALNVESNKMRINAFNLNAYLKTSSGIIVLSNTGLSYLFSIEQGVFDAGTYETRHAYLNRIQKKFPEYSVALFEDEERKKSNVRIILLPDDVEHHMKMFETIAEENPSRSLHWVVMDAPVTKEVLTKESKLYWRKSLGMPDHFRSYLLTTENDSLLPGLGEWINDNTITILSGKAGSGKTTFSFDFSSYLKETNPHHLIIQCNLKEYSKKLLNYSFDRLEDLVGFFSAMPEKSIETAIEKEILKYYFFKKETKKQNDSEKTISLFFDDFDLLSEEQQIGFFRLMKVLSGIKKIRMILITTRPDQAEKLSESFLVPFYCIKEFSLEKQEEFLKQSLNHYFDEVNHNINISKAYIENYSTELIHYLQRMDKNQFLVGMPLILKFLFEVFENVAENLVIKDNPEALQHALREKLSQPYLFELYEQFINRLYEIYFIRHAVSTENQKSILKDHFNHVFSELAFKQTFPDFQGISFSKSEDFEKSISRLLDVGIIFNVVNQGEVIKRFLHQTVQEFFAANYLKEALIKGRNTENDLMFRKEILDKIFYDPAYKRFKFFLNFQLAEHEPIIFASFKNDLNEVRRLFFAFDKNRPPPTLFTKKFGRNLAHDAVLYGDNDGKAIEFLRSLLQMEKNFIEQHPEHQAKLLVEVDELFGWAPIDYAIYNGDLTLFNFLLHEHREVLLKTDYFGNTLLHIAVENNRLDIVKELLKNFGDLNKKNMAGHSAFAIADQKMHFSIMVCLLEHGADLQDMKIENINKIDSFGKTLLHYAVSEGFIKTTELLITLANKQSPPIKINNIQDADGNQPLHIAVAKQHSELISFFPDAIDAVNFHGDTPLLIVVHYGFIELVKQLLFQWKANPYVKDRDGNTVLHVAIEAGNANMLELFLKDAEIHYDVHQANKKGDTIFHFAAKLGNSEIVRVLIAYDSSIMSDTNKNGFTPVDVAMINGHLDVLKICLAAGYALDDHLLEKNSVIDGLNVLHYVVANQYTEMFHFIIQRLSLDSIAQLSKIVGQYDETTLLHQAVSKAGNNEEIINALLKYDLNINQADRYGNTPIFDAIQSGQFSGILLLMQHHADLKHVNHMGEMPFDFAIKMGDMRIINVFFEYAKQSMSVLADLHSAIISYQLTHEWNQVSLQIKNFFIDIVAHIERLDPLLTDNSVMTACFSEEFLRVKRSFLEKCLQEKKQKDSEAITLEDIQAISTDEIAEYLERNPKTILEKNLLIDSKKFEEYIRIVYKAGPLYQEKFYALCAFLHEARFTEEPSPFIQKLKIHEKREQHWKKTAGLANFINTGMIGSKLFADLFIEPNYSEVAITLAWLFGDNLIRRMAIYALFSGKDLRIVGHVLFQRMLMGSMVISSKILVRGGIFLPWMMIEFMKTLKALRNENMDANSRSDALLTLFADGGVVLADGAVITADVLTWFGLVEMDLAAFGPIGDVIAAALLATVQIIRGVKRVEEIHDIIGDLMSKLDRIAEGMRAFLTLGPSSEIREVIDQVQNLIFTVKQWEAWLNNQTNFDGVFTPVATKVTPISCPSASLSVSPTSSSPPPKESTTPCNPFIINGPNHTVVVMNSDGKMPVMPLSPVLKNLLEDQPLIELMCQPYRPIEQGGVVLLKREKHFCLNTVGIEKTQNFTALSYTPQLDKKSILVLLTGSGYHRLYQKQGNDDYSFYIYIGQLFSHSNHLDNETININVDLQSSKNCHTVDIQTGVLFPSTKGNVRLGQQENCSGHTLKLSSFGVNNTVEMVMPTEKRSGLIRWLSSQIIFKLGTVFNNVFGLPNQQDLWMNRGELPPGVIDLKGGQSSEKKGNPGKRDYVTLFPSVGSLSQKSNSRNRTSLKKTSIIVVNSDTQIVSFTSNQQAVTYFVNLCRECGIHFSNSKEYEENSNNQTIIQEIVFRTPLNNLVRIETSSINEDPSIQFHFIRSRKAKKNRTEPFVVSYDRSLMNMPPLIRFTFNTEGFGWDPIFMIMINGELTASLTIKKGCNVSAVHTQLKKFATLNLAWRVAFEQKGCHRVLQMSSKGTQDHHTVIVPFNLKEYHLEQISYAFLMLHRYLPRDTNVIFQIFSVPKPRHAITVKVQLPQWNKPESEQKTTIDVRGLFEGYARPPVIIQEGNDLQLTVSSNDKIAPSLSIIIENGALYFQQYFVIVENTPEQIIKNQEGAWCFEAPQPRIIERHEERDTIATLSPNNVKTGQHVILSHLRAATVQYIISGKNLIITNVLDETLPSPGENIQPFSMIIERFLEARMGSISLVFEDQTILVSNVLHELKRAPELKEMPDVLSSTLYRLMMNKSFFSVSSTLPPELFPFNLLPSSSSLKTAIPTLPSLEEYEYEDNVNRDENEEDQMNEDEDQQDKDRVVSPDEAAKIIRQQILEILSNLTETQRRNRLLSNLTETQRRNRRTIMVDRSAHSNVSVSSGAAVPSSWINTLMQWFFSPVPNHFTPYFLNENRNDTGKLAKSSLSQIKENRSFEQGREQSRGLFEPASCMWATTVQGWIFAQCTRWMPRNYAVLIQADPTQQRATITHAKGPYKHLKRQHVSWDAKANTIKFGQDTLHCDPHDQADHYHCFDAQTKVKPPELYMMQSDQTKACWFYESSTESINKVKMELFCDRSMQKERRNESDVCLVINFKNRLDHHTQEQIIPLTLNNRVSPSVFMNPSNPFEAILLRQQYHHEMLASFQTHALGQPIHDFLNHLMLHTQFGELFPYAGFELEWPNDASRLMKRICACFYSKNLMAALGAMLVHSIGWHGFTAKQFKRHVMPWIEYNVFPSINAFLTVSGSSHLTLRPELSSVTLYPMFQWLLYYIANLIHFGFGMRHMMMSALDLFAQQLEPVGQAACLVLQLVFEIAMSGSDMKTWPIILAMHVLPYTQIIGEHMGIPIMPIFDHLIALQKKIIHFMLPCILYKMIDENFMAKLPETPSRQIAAKTASEHSNQRINQGVERLKECKNKGLKYAKQAKGIAVKTTKYVSASLGYGFFTPKMRCSKASSKKKNIFKKQPRCA